MVLLAPALAAPASVWLALLVAPRCAEVIVGNHDNGWASDDVVVSWGGGRAGQDEVLLAGLSTGWDGDGVAGAGASERSGDWAGGGDEVGSGGRDALGDGQGDLVTWLDLAGWGDSDRWESLESWELGGVAGRAASDELGSERVDLVEVKRNVEWSREWRLGWVLVVAEVGRVASLNGEDGASGSEVCLVGDELGSTKVGTHTNTLKNTSDSQELRCGGGAEGICARLDSSA